MVYADHLVGNYVGLVTLVDPGKTELHSGFLCGNISGKRLLWRLRRWNYNIGVGSKGLIYDYQLWMELDMNSVGWRALVIMFLILQFLLHNSSHVINNFTANINLCLMCVVKK
jgi:hypothetical protein